MRAVIGRKAGQKVTWNRLVTNGGGLAPGLSIADDGTKVVYTDTAGAYVYDSGNGIWNQIASHLNNHNSDQYQYVGYRGMVGLADCQIAPGNSNYIYYLMDDQWYNNRIGRAYFNKSTDKGLTSAPTSYPQNTQVDGSGGLIFASNNDTFKRVQCKIGIDPNNEQVVYVSNPGGQPLVTFDAGATFSNVPSLPVGTVTTVGACCWQFDRSSGTTTVNGKTVTKTIYCAIYGSGVWQSTNGGVSFARISSTVGALAPSCCSISDDGVYFITDAQVNSASFTGVISGTTLTATAVTGTINPGNPVSGSGVSGSQLIISQISGTPGGAGDYTVSTSQSLSSRAMTVASATYSTLNRWQSGAWAVIWQQNAASGSGASTIVKFSVAAHPTVNGTVCAMLSGGTPHFFASSDYGTTWTRTNKTSESVTPSADAPWYTSQIADSSFTMASQQMVFDRSNAGQLYFCYGQGLATGNITVGVAPTWAALTKGIEATVCNVTICESGVPVLQMVEDLFGFSHANPSGLQTPPTAPVAVGTILLVHGYCASIDPFDTAKQIVIGYNALSGAIIWKYSTDSGSSWTNCPTRPPDVLTTFQAPSHIVVSNGVIIYAPAGNGDGSTPALMYRITWANMVASVAWTALDSTHFNNGADFPATGWQGWGNSNVTPEHQVAFDRVDPNIVYASCVLFQSPVVKGMYVSTDAGVNWTYQGSSTDPAPSNDFGFMEIKAVPGVTGVLFATTGYNSVQPPPDTGTRASLYKLTWSGSAISLTQISTVKEVSYLGFGKAGPSGNATLYIAGFYNRSYGIFMSPDLGTTWTQLVSDTYGPWPIRNDAVYGIEGDKDVFGRCYVSFRGSGTAYSTLT